MKTQLIIPHFICPECGSLESAGGAALQGTGPRRSYTCAGCHLEIPAHLAERWGGLSAQDARAEWWQVYRPLARKPALAIL